MASHPTDDGRGNDLVGVQVADLEGVLRRIVRQERQDLLLHGSHVEAENVGVFRALESRPFEGDGRPVRSSPRACASRRPAGTCIVRHGNGGEVLADDSRPADLLVQRLHLPEGDLRVLALPVFVVGVVPVVVAVVELEVVRPDLGAQGERVRVAAEIEGRDIIHRVLDSDVHLEEVLILVEHVGLAERERHPGGGGEHPRELEGGLRVRAGLAQHEGHVELVRAVCAESQRERNLVRGSGLGEHLHVDQGTVEVLVFPQLDRGERAARRGERQVVQVGLPLDGLRLRGRRQRIGRGENRARAGGRRSGARCRRCRRGLAVAPPCDAAVVPPQARPPARGRALGGGRGNGRRRRGFPGKSIGVISIPPTMITTERTTARRVLISIFPLFSLLRAPGLTRRHGRDGNGAAFARRGTIP